MNIKFSVLLAIATLFPNHYLHGQDNDEPAPALIFILSLDGKEHAIESNAAKQIPGEFKNPNVKIRTAGYREFLRNDISFRYPENMIFDYEHDDGVKTWDLLGDDAELTVYCMQESSEVFIQHFVQASISFSENPQQKVDIKRGMKKVNGVKLKTYEYSIDSGDGYSLDTYAVELPTTTETRIFMFSSEFEDKKLVKECIELEKLVLGTLKWDSSKK